MSPERRLGFQSSGSPTTGSQWERQKHEAGRAPQERSTSSRHLLVTAHKAMRQGQRSKSPSAASSQPAPLPAMLSQDPQADSSQLPGTTGSPSVLGSSTYVPVPALPPTCSITLGKSFAPSGPRIFLLAQEWFCQTSEARHWAGLGVECES